MKTVIKKMLSLALVAMLLISAVPFQASATIVEITRPDGNNGSTPPANETEYTVTVKVWLYNDTNDSAIESIAVDGLTKEEYDEITAIASDDLNTAKMLLQVAGSRYAGITAENFKNNMVSGSTITVVLKSLPAGTTIPGAGEGNETVTVIVKKDAYSEGYPLKMVVGTSYLDKLATPENPGAKFLYWSSAAHGVVDANTKATENDTVTAVWEAEQYSLTLDENRAGEEQVNQIKAVYYGQPIGNLYTPTRKGYVFAGWKLNGKYITANSIWELQGDGTAYAQWKLESDTEGEAMGGNNNAVADGKVILEIYANGKTDAWVKQIDITEYAKDNKITFEEAKKVAQKYVAAKAGYTLKYDGLFDEESWWWYTRDEETDGSASVIVNRDGDDYVYIMVKNVKNTTNADTTNPKTGDAIALAYSVMGISGAMASALFLNKKRLFK